MPSWNGQALLGDCLDSLERQSYRDFEVVVVDNGSTDGSVELLREKYPWVNVVALDRNQGFAGGVNRGIEATRGRYVALLNNDAVADAGWLGHLTAAMEVADIAASKIVDHRDPGLLDTTGDFVSKWGLPYPRDRGFRDQHCYGDVTEVFSASGGAAMYRRDVFDEVGLFDERFFAYLEDVDLSFRARLRGRRAVFVSKAVVSHRLGATSELLGHFARHQMIKNSWYLLLKDFPATTLLRTLPRFLFVQLVLAAAAIRNGAGLAAVRAYAAVVAQLPGVLRDRRAIQRQRVISGADVTGWLTDQWPMDVGILGRVFKRLPGV